MNISNDVVGDKRMFVTIWSEGDKDLSEAPKKLKGKLLRSWIYGNLSKRKVQRFSEFEASDNLSVAKMLTRMIHVYKDVIPDGGIYPWTNFKLKGKSNA